jgi:preprotein translocase subunit SecB
MTDTNDAGAQPQPENGQAAAPGMNILGQYIKDLSFENPNAPMSLQQGEQPKLDINVNVNAAPLGEDQFEVVLTLSTKAERADMVMFAVELVYAGVFRITGVPQEHMHPFVMIECPRMLFPFARSILADATRNGGFPPLLLDPIDFAQLYRQNMAQQAAAEQAAGSQEKPN